MFNGANPFSQTVEVYLTESGMKTVFQSLSAIIVSGGSRSIFHTIATINWTEETRSIVFGNAIESVSLSADENNAALKPVMIFGSKI